MPTVKVVKVKSNGKRFLLISEADNKVHVKGDVLRVSGSSALHGPDKTFLRDRVEIEEAEYGEDLLKSLLAESPTSTEPVINVSVKKRKKFAVRSKWDGGRFELTDYGRRQLKAQGYDIASDYLCDKPEDGEDMLQDMAADAARYHHELSIDGVPEIYEGLREVAADYIYEGMCKALAERKA